MSTYFFQQFGPLNVETLNEVPISRAVCLATGESVKTAILLELDITVRFIKSSLLLHSSINSLKNPHCFVNMFSSSEDVPHVDLSTWRFV